MLKIFAESIFAFLIVMLLLSIVNIGCSSKNLEQLEKKRHRAESKD